MKTTGQDPKKYLYMGRSTNIIDLYQGNCTTTLNTRVELINNPPMEKNEPGDPKYVYKSGVVNVRFTHP